MIQRLLILGFVACVLSFAVHAQPQGTPPDPAVMVQMRVNMLASQLALTDAQKASATTIFTNAATAAQSIQTNLHTAQQSVWSAVKANNTATIDQLSASIGTMEGQLMAIQMKAEAAFYAILTATQQAQYDAMSHGGPGGRGPGGGGMMGPQMRGMGRRGQ